MNDRTSKLTISRNKWVFALCGALACAMLGLSAISTAANTDASMQAESSAKSPASSASSSTPADLVYPLLDSANSRWFYFDSASLPFGMVNLSPDTGLGGAWGSGYRYNETSVKGFSHVHAWQLSAISMMPLSFDLNTLDVESASPALKLSKQQIDSIRQDYFSPFSHDSEIVNPGYHKLYLDRYNTQVELSATTRVGIHKYTFDDEKTQHVLFQMGGEMGPSSFGHAEAYKVSGSSIAGYVTNEATHRRPRPTKVYFHAEFDRPIQTIDAWRTNYGNLSIEPQVSGTSGKDAGLIVSFDSAQSMQLQMKVGISYVSAENAKLNMQSELGHWDFDSVRQGAKDTWNQWLSRIKIEGGTLQQQRRFYTDLWHALQGRRILSDVNGQYTDQTGMQPAIKQIPLNTEGQPQFNHHNSDSFWGAQWTIATLWPLAYPSVASDFSNSLLQYYHDGGILPRGPSGGNYTFVMTGASSTPFMVSNYMKGIRDFDIDLAFEALEKNHNETGIMSRAGYEHFTQSGGGMRHYLEKGYILYPLSEAESKYGNHRRGPGQTLEYAFQDHTLAHFAQALGKSDTAEYYFKRAQNYRNVYDAESGFMRPKNLDGSWQTPFDPFEYENGFVEANPAQATWFVPHDIDGLASLMGGKEILVERLDQAFIEAQKQGFTSGKAHADETKERYRRTPINYGNQPSMQTAFIFTAAGAANKTQYWSRQVVDEVFSTLTPDRGYNGDEDQGLMGSLAVLMKIGLFQLTGGTEPDPIYLIGSPIFDKISIALDNEYYSGQRFDIVTVNNSVENMYVQSVKLNDKTLERMYLRHSEIVNGGTLTLEMGPKPNLQLN